MPHHVLLVPGFFGFTSRGDFTYFGHVRDLLVELGPRAGLDGEIRFVQTDPTASLRRRAARVVEAIGDLIDGPGGEVSLPPLEGTADGVVVWERVASDLGALDEPIRIEVRDGRAVDIQGGTGAGRLRDIVATVRDADNIGEIGIGLNRAARIGDQITEAKKAYGTVHVALGDSANEYGGTVECEVHLDGLVLQPTIAFDGRDIVVDGRHLYAGGADG